jgi:hypothetical protein
VDLLRDFIFAAGGAFGGGAIVLAGERIIRWFSRPIIKLCFDRNAHKATVITVKTVDVLSVVRPGTWFRLRVSNDGNSTAEGCEVSIVKLVRTAPTPYEYENDPISLLWSFIGLPAVNMHAKTARFSDALLVRNDSFRLCGQVPNYLHDELEKSFEGAQFEITLRVSGDNFAPIAKTVICG